MVEKVLTPEEAMAAFMKDNQGAKATERSSSFNAGFRLQNDQGTKTFARGVVLNRREQATGQKNDAGKEKINVWYTLKLSQVSVPLTKGVTTNGKTEYVQVPFVSGDEVDTMAPVDLDRKLQGVAPGTEVFITYNGMVAKATKKGKVRMHDFTVVPAVAVATAQAEPI